MNVRIDTPQIKILLAEVERRAGFHPYTRADFEALADKIRVGLHTHISESTLERVWQYSTRQCNGVAIHTLNLFARYAGYTDWQDFVTAKEHEMHPESAQFEGGINIARLEEGTRLLLMWNPSRRCVVHYLGACRFVVEQVELSSLTVGDTFSCNHICVGQPLYMDHYMRAESCDGAMPSDSTETAASSDSRYVVGRDTGLTYAKILTSEE